MVHFLSPHLGQSTPFNIRITEFREGENTVDLILEDNGEEISGLSLTVTIGTESGMWSVS